MYLYSWAFIVEEASVWEDNNYVIYIYFLIWQWPSPKKSSTWVAGCRTIVKSRGRPSTAYTAYFQVHLKTFSVGDRRHLQGGRRPRRKHEAFRWARTELTSSFKLNNAHFTRLPSEHLDTSFTRQAITKYCCSRRRHVGSGVKVLLLLPALGGWISVLRCTLSRGNMAGQTSR